MSGRLPWTRDDDYHSRHTGTFGEVHIWKRIVDGKKEMAVVKIPTVPQHIGKFKAERDKMWQIEHTNIVKCLSANIFNDDFDLSRHYKNGISWQDVIVMEYCNAGNLRRVFNKHRQGLDLSSVLRLVSDVGSALQYLHEDQHIIHRDIKPENILLDKTSDGQIMYKVADLGEVTEVHTAAGFTHISTLCTHGTFAYMAPEQLLLDPDDGTMKMNETADLWGFGTILSEATFGVRPFFHDHGHAIHTALTSYCQTILDKPDNILYIHKQGKLTDPKHPPVYCKDIPHSGVLPGVVVDKINSILTSALTGSRKKRGEPLNGRYMIYQQIRHLSNLKVVKMFDCSTLQITYHDTTPLPDNGMTYLTEEGILLTNTQSNPDSSMVVCVTSRGERDVVLPSIPLSLLKYFSEPFPFYKKEVERGIEGYLHIIQSYLALLETAADILNTTITRLYTQCTQSAVPRLSSAERVYSSVAELCNGLIKPSLTEPIVEALSVSKSEFATEHSALLKECDTQSQYIDSWCDVFRGLNEDVEWTEVYTLVNQFKEDFTTVVTKMLHLQSMCAVFIAKVEEVERQCTVEEGVLKEAGSSMLTATKPEQCRRKQDEGIQQLLEKNKSLYNEFIAECELLKMNSDR